MASFSLPPAHRLARINYPVRALAFAYSFLVLEALMAERGLNIPVLVFGALTFLLYPHLAYVHARIAVDSKQAELRNLVADSALLGAWAAQMEFALWPCCGLFSAICLNNAANAGVKRLLCGAGVFAGTAVLWGASLGWPLRPWTGPLVSGLCFAGIVVYTSAVGIILFQQNRRLVAARDALRTSEEQFRFIAEHVGDLVAALAPDGRIRYASASHREYFAAGSVEEGADWFELIHADDRHAARGFLQRLLLSRTPERISLRFAVRSGLPRVFECDGNPVWEPRGGVAMAILVLRDMTARVRA